MLPWDPRFLPPDRPSLRPFPCNRYGSDHNIRYRPLSYSVLPRLRSPRSRHKGWSLPKNCPEKISHSLALTPVPLHESWNHTAELLSDIAVYPPLRLQKGFLLGNQTGSGLPERYPYKYFLHIPVAGNPDSDLYFPQDLTPRFYPGNPHEVYGTVHLTYPPQGSGFQNLQPHLYIRRSSEFLSVHLHNTVLPHGHRFLSPVW